MVRRGSVPPSSKKIRNSSNGLTEPTIRSSSAYLRLLKWKPPSRPSAPRMATICSMLAPVQVVAEVDQHLRPLAQLLAGEQRRPPVGEVGRVERRLERLVLEQQLLRLRRRRVQLGQAVEHPRAPRHEVVLPRVAGAVREPQRLRGRAELARDLHALEQVVGRLAADGRVGMRDRAELVVGVLEQVRVDGADPQPARLGVGAQRRQIVDLIPREVQRDGRGRAGQPVHLGRVVDALEHVARPAGLLERRKARPGVAVAPRRGLDFEC